MIQSQTSFIFTSNEPQLKVDGTDWAVTFSLTQIINSLKPFHIYTPPLKVLALSCDGTPGSRSVVFVWTMTAGRAFPVFHRGAVFAGGIRLIDWELSVENNGRRKEADGDKGENKTGGNRRLFYYKWFWAASREKKKININIIRQPEKYQISSDRWILLIRQHAFLPARC